MELFGQINHQRLCGTLLKIVCLIPLKLSTITKWFLFTRAPRKTRMLWVSASPSSTSRSSTVGFVGEEKRNMFFLAIFIQPAFFLARFSCWRQASCRSKQQKIYLWTSVLPVEVFKNKLSLKKILPCCIEQIFSRINMRWNKVGGGWGWLTMIYRDFTSQYRIFSWFSAFLRCKAKTLPANLRANLSRKFRRREISSELSSHKFISTRNYVHYSVKNLYYFSLNYFLRLMRRR